MSASRRSSLFWALAGLFFVVSTTLQATPRAAPPDDKAQPDAQEKALLAGFRCALSLLTFQPGEAEKFCGTTIALLPNSPMGYKFRGFAYLLEHRYERAEIDFREAVRLDGSDPDNQAGLGQAMSGQGRFDEAIARFGIALHASPHDARYLAARCWARAGQGTDFPAALRDCDQALKYAPGSAVAYDDRGLVRLRQNEDAKALQDYTKSLALQPGRSTALFGRGIAEWHLGRLAAARSDLSLAREADPDIDETFILLSVLPPSCRGRETGCPLPKDLMAPQTPARFYAVSFRIKKSEALVLQP